ncbi:hypothetical protein BJ742DRAFT_36058 [Cladochytrium replicatum]|nr:hypothetical protein BJ742DRAFT_36058 [Cladochytrium replicatum]
MAFIRSHAPQRTTTKTTTARSIPSIPTLQLRGLRLSTADRSIPIALVNTLPALIKKMIPRRHRLNKRSLLRWYLIASTSKVPYLMTVPQTPLPPSVQDAIDNLAKAAEKESFAEFRIFPEQLRPLLHQAARQADSELCLDENFIGHVTTVLPYNAFTMKRLIGRMLYPEQLAALQETSDRLCERLKEEVAIAVDMQMKSAPLDFTISMDAGENGGESKRKFKWNKELKLLLWNIVTTACQISDKEHDLAVVRKPSKDKTEVPRTSEMAVRRNVYAKLCSYWPPGWMSTLDISREWSQQKRKIDRQDKADKPPPKTGTEGQFEDPEVGKGEGTPDDGVGEGAKKRGKVKADKNGRGATTWTGAEIQANPTYTMVQEHAPFAHPTSEPVAMGGRLDEYDVSRAPMGQSYDPSTMSPSRSSSQPNHQHLPRSGFHDSAGVRMEWRPDLADHAPGMQYSGHFQQAPNGGRAEGSGTEVVVNRPQMQTPTGPIRPQFPTMVEESVDHRSPNRHIHPQQQYQQIYHPSVPPGLIRPDHHVMQQPRANNRNPHELGNVTEQHYNQPGPMVDTYFVQTHPGAVRPHPLHSPYHALPGNGQHGSPGPGQQQQSEVDPYARRPW